jgi:hypothetical protein
MAWSFAARQGRGDPNSLWNARAYEAQVLEACGLPPGQWLGLKMKDDRITRFAEEDNAKAAVRRDRNERWNAEWAVMQAREAERDRLNLERRERADRPGTGRPSAAAGA